MIAILGLVHRNTKLLAAIVAAIVTLHPLGGAAQEEEREQTAAARAMFEAGIELADAGDWEAAADRFRRSLALRPSSVVAYNLGMALTHTGELVEATELFRGATRDPEAPDRLREAARRELESLEPRLGRLTVHLHGPTEGVELALDDAPLPLEMVGVAVPADPGDHVLSVRRGERVVARAEVTVPEGAAAQASLTVPPPPVPSPEETARAASADSAPAQPPAASEGGGDDGAVWAVVITLFLAAAAAAAVTTWYFLDGQEVAEPIGGNLMPGTVELGL